jgi:hypothetical protein
MYETSTDETSSHDKPTQGRSHLPARHQSSWARPATSRRVPSSPAALAPRGWRAVGATMMLAAALSACDARESPTPKTNPGVSGTPTMGATGGANSGTSTGKPSGADINAPSGPNVTPATGTNGGNTGAAGGSAPAHAPPGPPANPPDNTTGTGSPQLPDQTGGPGSRAPAGSGSASGGAGTSGMSGSGAAAGSGGSADERR